MRLVTVSHHATIYHAKLVANRPYFISNNTKQPKYNININKEYQQTAGFLRRLANIPLLLVIGLTVAMW